MTNYSDEASPVDPAAASAMPKYEPGVSGYGSATPGYGNAPSGYGPGYGQGAPIATSMRNGLGTAALILGILAVVLCWTVIGGVVLGVVALGIGIPGRARVRHGQATNGGSAIAGIVLGAIGVVASVALVVVGISVLHSPRVQNLRNCDAKAHGNQAAISQCDKQFASIG